MKKLLGYLLFVIHFIIISQISLLSNHAPAGVNKFLMDSQFYTCCIVSIDNANLKEPGIKLSIQEKHIDGRTNNDVTVIAKNNFSGTQNLEALHIEHNPISPGDLFRHFSLQKFSIHNNSVT